MLGRITVLADRAALAAVVLLLVCLCGDAWGDPDCGAAQKWQFVHTWQPRHTTKVGPMDDAANWQRLNDLERVWQQAESDVRLTTLGGKTVVIHNCTSSPDVCTAQEARVSPDGKRIVYSVSKGGALNKEVWANGYDTGLREFETVTAELWLYEIATGKRRRLSSGHIDRSPTWCGNDCIVFASDRAGTYAPQQLPGVNYYKRKAFHNFRARITDSGLADVVDISPAEYFTMNPEVTTRGRVVYSSFQGVNSRFPREFGVSTFLHWWICSTDINGNDLKCHLGAHGSGQIKRRELIADWVDPKRAGEINTAIRGLRVIGEIYPDFLTVVNYYAGRGAGGVILGWQHSDAEGALYEKDIPAMAQFAASSQIGSGRYVPSTLLNMTPGRNDQDTTEGIYHRDGRGAGRESHPAPWPDSYGLGKEAWLSTGWRGRCYENAKAEEATVKAQGGEPTCKREIRVNLVRQVRNPFDTAQGFCILGCDLGEHAYDARAVVPYSDLYGIDTPQIAPIVTAEKCALVVTDSLAAELWPIPGKTDESWRVAFQGNAVSNYADVAHSFGVEYFDHHKSTPTREGHAKDYPPHAAKITEIGAVALDVECGRPFRHFGYAAAGKKVASGLSPMAAMGVMVCTGCHVHSESRRAAMEGVE